MTSSDERPRRFSFRVKDGWLQRLDEWRLQEPRTLTRTEAIRRLVEIGLEADSRKKGLKQKSKTSLVGTEADFFIHAKAVSAFNGVLSILGVLAAKKLVDQKELSRIHDTMSKPFSGERDRGLFLMADAQRRLDDLLAQLSRSLKPPTE